MANSGIESFEDVQALVARYIDVGDDEADNNARGVMLRYMNSVVPKTKGGQLAFGGAGGLLTGYLVMKIGKAAAFAVGTSLLGLQLAHYYGYVKVDWEKLDKDLANRGTEFIRRSKARKLDQKSARTLGQLRRVLAMTHIRSSHYIRRSIYGVSVDIGI